MRPYIDTKRDTILPEKLKCQPTNNTKWGELQPRISKNLSEGQQGYMNRQEVSGETATSASLNQPKAQAQQISTIKFQRSQAWNLIN